MSRWAQWTATIVRGGNHSLRLTIPKNVILAYGLEHGQYVTVNLRVIE